ncbi:MAG: hypothetical protein QOH13_2202 [Thermoleophilaceae bacterium]|nr:hypothetical protein [Thermoleophilaceae bacterium]
MDWKPEHTLALIPMGAAIFVSIVILIFGGSANTAQWAAIIAFLVSLPFVIGRLIDRAR